MILNLEEVTIMLTLDNTISEEYQKACKEADALLEDNHYEAALIRFQEALNMLPDGFWGCEAYAYAGKGKHIRPWKIGKKHFSLLCGCM
jgi:hypothetical protein